MQHENERTCMNKVEDSKLQIVEVINPLIANPTK